MGGQYSAVATTPTPALVIYIFDISGSMAEAFEGSTRMEHVNNAIENSLWAVAFSALLLRHERVGAKLVLGALLVVLGGVLIGLGR